MKKKIIKSIAILTSGGDAPGMNAAIRATTRTALNKNLKVNFIYNGFKGIINRNIKTNITSSDVGSILNEGGTIIRTSRYLDFLKESVRKEAVKILKEYKIDALIVIGGNGSFIGADKLGKFGIPFIGLPGTIDNNISETEETIGFDTCLNTITDAIDKIRDTSSSHLRCTIIETMGGYCGDLALYAGIASGCDLIITPTKKLEFKEICDFVKERKNNGKHHTIIIVTEWMFDIFELAKKITDETGVNSRASKLGFIQRGGRPSFRDRYLAALMGIKSVELLLEGITNHFIGLKNNKICHFALKDENITHDAVDIELLNKNRLLL